MGSWVFCEVKNLYFSGKLTARDRGRDGETNESQIPLGLGQILARPAVQPPPPPLLQEPYGQTGQITNNKYLRSPYFFSTIKSNIKFCDFFSCTHIVTLP